MNLFYVPIAALTAVLILVSCSPSTLELSVAESLPAVDISTLPRGIRLVESNESTVWKISAATLRTADEPALALSREFLVPAVSWLDGRQDISAADLSQNGQRLIPLRQLSLPDKLLAVDGRYPGDEDYPLVDWTVLNLERPTSAYHRRPLYIRKRGDRLESWLAEQAAAALAADYQEYPDPAFYTLAAVGDIMPGRGFGELLTGPNGIDQALGDVAPLLIAPDLLIGNLETAVTESESELVKSYNFKVSEDVLGAVAALGFDFFHLANNHSWDYGEKGFLDTLDAVNRRGIGYSGAGLDINEARSSWESRMPGAGLIRVLSLGAYFTERNGFDGASAAAAAEGKAGVLWDSPENEDYIRSVLAVDDVFTVITVHGGYEWEDLPRSDVRERYRRYVEWGADLVLAHHPHVLQGMEIYRGAPIAYSLGNFIFPGMTGWYSGEETGVLEFLLHDGSIVGINFQAVKINDVTLRRADDQGIEKRFWQMSAEQGTPDRD